MKLPKSTIHQISTAIRESGTREDSEDGLELFLLEDATLAFISDSNGKPIFHGLSFEMVGRDLHVLPDLELTVAETIGDDEDAETEVYVIEDEDFVQGASQYLLWRSKFLSSLKL